MDRERDESAYELYARGLGMLQSGNAHAAVNLLTRAKSLEPNKGSIRETLARALFQSGRMARARREFTKAVQIEPVNDYAHFGLGLSCARTGQRSRAVAHLKLAVAMRPEREEYRAALARLTTSRRTAS
jgi:Flp pilus assembly protein TadD